MQAGFSHHPSSEVPSRPAGKARRLLLAVTKGVRGGAQQYVASLATGMRALDWDVEVVFGVGEELGEWCRQQGIVVHRVALDNPINPPKDALAGWQLYWLMRRGRYDVVHINSTKAGIVGLAAAHRARVPVKVFTAHGFRSILLTTPRQRRFWTWMERRYLRHADRVIAVSNHELRVCQDTGVLPPGKGVAIHNGVSLARVDAGAQAGRQRQELGLDDKDLVVGTIARLEPAKAMTCWLRTAQHVAQREPRARFVVVGDGPESGLLRALAAELSIGDRVIWAGRRMGAEYLPLFDVFLLTSLYEGFSIALLEAMAARRPVVATRVGGTPEAISEGVTGLLAPSGDVTALAEAVLSLLADEPRRRAMGEQARARVAREFTEGTMVSRVAALYQDLLARRDTTKPER